MKAASPVFRLCVLVLLPVTAVAAAGEEQGYIGVQIKASPTGMGVLIVMPQADSPAEKAGLQANDIILKADGKAVETVSGFVEMVREIKPGATLVLVIQRGDKEMEVKVKVGKRPPDPPPSK
jgi:S1-C subfamily serine protease